VIVVASHGVIWYHDNHSDFVPDNSFNLSFSTPSEIQFLTSNEKSSLLWTCMFFINFIITFMIGSNNCYVIGSTLGLIEEEKLYSGVNFKSSFTYKWHPIEIPNALSEDGVKQIVGCGDHFYMLTGR
jgi:hypothetical protein